MPTNTQIFSHTEMLTVGRHVYFQFYRGIRKTIARAYHSLRYLDEIIIQMGLNFKCRICHIARTWMTQLLNVFIFFEDTVDSRFLFRHCQSKDSENFTSFACMNEPRYVLLRSSICKEYTNGSSEQDIDCCRVDSALKYLMFEDHYDIFSNLKFLFLR